MLSSARWRAVAIYVFFELVKEEARSTACSMRVLVGSPSLRNCFGRVLVLTGQNRSPDPPAMIIAIRWFILID